METGARTDRIERRRLDATGSDLDRQTDSETARWFLRGFEGITGSAAAKWSGVEWRGVGAAHEPSTKADGDARISSNRKKKKAATSFSPCLRVPLISSMRYFSSDATVLAVSCSCTGQPPAAARSSGSPVPASPHRTEHSAAGVLFCGLL